MKVITSKWEYVSNELNILYNKIFKGININDLSDYEKRKIIFKYLCNNVKYDYKLLDKIKSRRRIPRDPYLEIESVLKNSIGICNSISQVYKLLLEKVNIYSLCVICDDGTDVKHQLNLVYDEYNNSFSFDDITSVIVDRGNIDEYFDYDIEDANSYNQGNKSVYKNYNWIYLSTGYIYALVGRKDTSYFKHNIENKRELNFLSNINAKKKNKKLERRIK